MPVSPITPDGLDAEGYIEIRCAIERISPFFRPVVDESIARLETSFGPRLHSIYLYGSVAIGEAKPRQSDLDILVVIGDAMFDPDHARLKQITNSLSATNYASVREVGIGAVSIQQALADENLAGLGCFIKHLCVCVTGEDIRPRLPKFRPTIEVARGFNGDFAAVMQAKLQKLAKTNQTKAAQAVMRQICRKIVRTGFSLVMPRLGCWTTDLDRSAEYFCSCYPQMQAAMAMIVAWTRQPPEDRAEFLRTVTSLVEWLTAEFERVICNLNS